jgi:hypothetical protein
MGRFFFKLKLLVRASDLKVKAKQKIIKLIQKHQVKHVLFHKTVFLYRINTDIRAGPHFHVKLREMFMTEDSASLFNSMTNENNQCSGKYRLGYALQWLLSHLTY